MKRFFLIFCLTLTVAFPTLADGKGPGSRKAQIRRLQEENTTLRARLDSLLLLLEAPAAGYAEVALPETVAAETGPEAREFTAEVSDSLMDLWYRERRIADYEQARGYDLDSVRFTSRVDDTEMMRRLAAMNAYISLPFNGTVKNYMILYSEKMPRNMAVLLGRSEYYFPIFEEAFARYGLPLELKYLAVIESNLNPVAESKAGAMGMWQFMYRTARLYGLKINSFVDERLDVEKAADAAARYLRDAYSVFGDWNLAICSYNCGSGNVNKAIKRAGKRDFWSIYDYLPRETRGYVPAFVGAMYAFNYAREYGLRPADAGMPAVTDTFEIHRNLHFRQVSEVAGIPLETIKRLNPQYTHDIVPGNEGTCILQLPYNCTSAFLAANTDSLYAYKASELLNPQVIKNIQESGSEVRVAYKVKEGDILGRIASRNGVSVAQIKKWNHLRSDIIRPGQILYIYKKQK